MRAAGDSSEAPRASAVRALIWLTVAALLFAALVALGVWQIHRLSWKRDLIARVEQRRQSAPVAAPGPRSWPTLSQATDEYRRVQVRGRFANERETLVSASTELGSGYWVLTPLCTDGGFWLLVNRGFVPSEWRTRASRAATEPQGMQTVRGLLRLSEPRGSLLQRNDPVAGRWYSRDVPAIAAARDLKAGGACGPVAPYFIDAVDEPELPRWPRAGLTVLRLSNNHAMYALTWFTLAAMVAAAAVQLLRYESRLRRPARSDAR